MQNESERADPQTTPAGDGQETADRDAVRHSADGESLITVDVSAAPETASNPDAAVPRPDAEPGDTAEPAAAAAMLPSRGRETIIEIDQDDDDATPVGDETADTELPPRGGETIIEIESTANRAEPAPVPASALTPAATSPAMPEPASAMTPEPPETAPPSGTPTAGTTEVDRPDPPEPAAEPSMTTGVETTRPGGAPEPGADPDAAPPLIEAERLRAQIDSANRESAEITEGSGEVHATETHDADEATALTETPEAAAPSELLDANLTSRISQSLHGSADWSPWDGLTGDLAPAETAEVITRGILRAAAGLIDAARPDGLKKTDGLGEAAAFTIAAMHVEHTFGTSIGEIVASGGTAAARAFNVLRRTARELEAGTRRLKRERRRRPDKAPPPNPGALTHDRDADANATAAPPHESYDASEQDAPSVETADPADPTPAADDPSNLEQTEVSSERRQPAPARINLRADDPDELEKETAPPHESYDADEREAPSVETSNPPDPTPPADETITDPETHDSPERRQAAPAQRESSPHETAEVENDPAPPHESYDADERHAPPAETPDAPDPSPPVDAEGEETGEDTKSRATGQGAGSETGTNPDTRAAERAAVRTGLLAAAYSYRIGGGLTRSPEASDSMAMAFNAIRAAETVATGLTHLDDQAWTAWVVKHEKPIGVYMDHETTVPGTGRPDALPDWREPER